MGGAAMKVKWVARYELFEDKAEVHHRHGYVETPVVRVSELRPWLEHVLEYWNGSANERAMTDALEHILGEADTLLISLPKEEEEQR